MRISIVTVAYNSAATIADTLKSVAAQTHPDVEHIVIDGASSDGTLDVVRVHGSHVSKLVSERDEGIYDAMNKGLGLATGEFVGFLNADDMLAGPDVVIEIVRAASAKGVDAVFGDLVYVKKDSRAKSCATGAAACSRSRIFDTAGCRRIRHSTCVDRGLPNSAGSTFAFASQRITTSCCGGSTARGSWLRTCRRFSFGCVREAPATGPSARCFRNRARICLLCDATRSEGWQRWP